MLNNTEADWLLCTLCLSVVCGSVVVQRPYTMYTNMVSGWFLPRILDFQAHWCISHRYQGYIYMYIGHNQCTAKPKCTTLYRFLINDKKTTDFDIN